MEIHQQLNRLEKSELEEICRKMKVEIGTKNKMIFLLLQPLRNKLKKKCTIVSWNVNSIRSRILDEETGKCRLNPRPVKPTSPLGELISSVNPDIICFQETKCTYDTRQCFQPEGFFHFWNCATHHITWKKGKKEIKPVKGYSGVAIWSKIKPNKITRELPGLPVKSEFLNQEGRILTAFYDKFILITTYTPNTLRAGDKQVSGKFQNPEMMLHRKNWDETMGKYIRKLEESKPVIWCGDLNVARTSLDIYKGELTRQKLEKYGTPKFISDKDEPVVTFNEKTGLSKGDKTIAKKLKKRWFDGMLATYEGGGAGYRLEERKQLEAIIQKKFIDAFRYKNPTKIGFTYWDLTRPAFRRVNYGLRLDYFIVSKRLAPKIKDVFVDPNLGVKANKVASDHAPIILQLKF